MNDDFDLTEEILAIMEGLDDFPECCRRNLLKMTAAWERDMIALRAERDAWKKKAMRRGPR